MEEATPIHPTVSISSRRELFVDHHLIDRMENARLTLHEPISGGVALRIDRPGGGPANGPMPHFVAPNYMQESWHNEGVSRF